MPSKLINPWGTNGDAWDFIIFGGVRFEGLVDVTGTPWKKKNDHRKARGRNGARSVATGWDLGKWTLTLTAIEDEDIEVLGRLIEAVTQRGEGQDTNALPIEHPALLVAGVTQVTFEEGEAPEPDRVGKLTWKCKVTEYRPPTPRDVTRAPAPAPQAAEDAPLIDRGELSPLGRQEYLATRAPTPPSADP